MDYEAVSDEHGLQHVEHSLLSDTAIHVAFGEAPGLTVFRSRGDGMFEVEGERPMRIGVSFEKGQLIWAWYWGTGSGDVVERSRAVCRLADC